MKEKMEIIEYHQTMEKGKKCLLRIKRDSLNGIKDGFRLK